MYLYSYNGGSEGAKELAAALKVQRIRHENSNFVGRSEKVVINWGASEVPAEVAKCRIINNPERVSLVTNKLEFFRVMADAKDGPRLPPWTTDTNVAVAWYTEDKTVVCRTVLNGSGGNGIYLSSRELGNDIRSCRLYTQYVPKKDEYRVHFVNGKIIDYQRKALRPDYNKDMVNWKVRNLEGGFIYVRNDVFLPADVTVQAEKTIAALGLDFGAIDIIYNEKSKQAYVLEVNTAPGLVGTTLANYAKAFEAFRPTSHKAA